MAGGVSSSSSSLSDILSLIQSKESAPSHNGYERRNDSDKFAFFSKFGERLVLPSAGFFVSIQTMYGIYAVARNGAMQQQQQQQQSVQEKMDPSAAHFHNREWMHTIVDPRTQLATVSRQL
jgi:hypothetical protein